MANNGTDQALIDWKGDASSLILEMKRRARVRTDTELAELIGMSQSSVSTWKRRGIVPKQAVLLFEKTLLERELDEMQGSVAALAIAMRAAEFMFQRARDRGSRAGRWLPYSVAAVGLKALVGAVEITLVKLHKQTGRWSLDLAQELIEDEHYLGGIADWIEAAEASELLATGSPGFPEKVPQ